MYTLTADEKRICAQIVNDPTYCSSDQGYDARDFMAPLAEYLNRGDFSPAEMERTLSQLTNQVLRDIRWTLAREATEGAKAADVLQAHEEARDRLERSLGMSLPRAA